MRRVECYLFVDNILLSLDEGREGRKAGVEGREGRKMGSKEGKNKRRKKERWGSVAQKTRTRDT